MSPSPTIMDLGQKVKAKYPGQYDDLPDAEIGRRVKGKFPDAYGDFAELPTTKAPEGSAAGRFLKGAWDTTVGGLDKGVKMAADLAATGGALATGSYRAPSQETQDAMKGMVNAHIDQGRQAAEAWRKGDRSEAVGHAMAAAIPLVGPAAAGAAEKIGGQEAQFDKFGNVVKPQQLPDVAGGLGEAAGLITASSPKSIVAPALRGTAAVMRKIPVPARLTPEGLYQSALRPSLAGKNLPKIDRQVATGLKEGIPVSGKGLEKTRGVIDEVNADIAEGIKEKSEELGPVVSPKDVVSYTSDVPDSFDTVNPEKDMAAIQASRDEFLRKHQTEAPYTKIRPGTNEAEGTMVPEGQGVTTTEKPLTLSEAQAEKQKTYGQIRKKFGELSSAQVETQKGLARGLKENIVQRYPEISELNARDSALIDLESQLEKAVSREGNKNVVSLVPAAATSGKVGIMAAILDNPAIKSRIAIALDRVRAMKGLPPATTAPIISGAAIAGNAGRPPATQPPQ